MTAPSEQATGPEPVPPRRHWGVPVWLGALVMAPLAVFGLGIVLDAPLLHGLAGILLFVSVVVLGIGIVVVGEDRIERTLARRGLAREARGPHPLQFSLRSLLVILTLGAVVCSGLKMLPQDVVVLTVCVLAAIPLIAIALALPLAATQIITILMERLVARLRRPGRPSNKEPHGAARSQGRESAQGEASPHLQEPPACSDSDGSCSNEEDRCHE